MMHVSKYLGWETPMKSIKSHCRQMHRGDMPSVMDIEARSFEEPWNEVDFFAILRKPNGIGMVLEHDGQAVGYMVYLLLPTRIYIARIAVDPKFRRLGFGTELINRMKSRLEMMAKYRMLSSYVPETNLEAQLFLKSCGFRANRIERDLYADKNVAAYRMVFKSTKEKSS